MPTNYGPPVGAKEWYEDLLRALKQTAKRISDKPIAEVLLNQRYFNGIGKH